ncbi:MAG: SCO family protein, partial [Candidatus Latescibacteria bacterium]|nr:SCO family protein [Candidatus Latescibacterota bacterium]
PEGRLARYLFGVEFAPRDLQLGLLEALQDKISSPVDVIFLYCFQYNPLTGKYTLAIYRLVQIAGVITVVCILGFIILMVRRERSSLQAS